MIKKIKTIRAELEGKENWIYFANNKFSRDFIKWIFNEIAQNNKKIYKKLKKV